MKSPWRLCSTADCPECVILGAGESEVGAEDSVAVQLGAGESHHVAHPDRPLHGACLALPLRLPSPRQHRLCLQTRPPGELLCPSLPPPTPSLSCPPPPPPPPPPPGARRPGGGRGGGFWGGPLGGWGGFVCGRPGGGGGGWGEMGRGGVKWGQTDR